MKIINSYFPGIPAEPSLGAQVCAVLMQDENGAKGFSVYLGIVARRPEGEHAESEAWVAAFGTKLRYRDSLMFFPTLKEEEYRS